MAVLPELASTLKKLKYIYTRIIIRKVLVRKMSWTFPVAMYPSGADRQQMYV